MRDTFVVDARASYSNYLAMLYLHPPLSSSCVLFVYYYLHSHALSFWLSFTAVYSFLRLSIPRPVHLDIHSLLHLAEFDAGL
jgi:hypothetical protein